MGLEEVLEKHCTGMGQAMSVPWECCIRSRLRCKNNKCVSTQLDCIHYHWFIQKNFASGNEEVYCPKCCKFARANVYYSISSLRKDTFVECKQTLNVCWTSLFYVPSFFIKEIARIFNRGLPEDFVFLLEQ